ncbi:MAG: preprotein translocase subunit SecE [Psychroflexus sp.]|jgi:preprotein translocase subunit SecE|nr:preprotein translocase subunit SecE [Psychroflexus sp.]MDR9447809.1 preprotein translocase subunit SecE [Psychroflexus sp.]
MAGIKEYVQESYYELKNNVTWPSYQEGQRLMLIVAVFVVVLALLIFGVDTVFSKAIEQYFNWVK